MTTDRRADTAIEAYRTHQEQRNLLFASAFIGLGLFAIAYASWPAGQNKDLAEPLGITMTLVSLLLIIADTQISVHIERVANALAETTTEKTSRPHLQGSALRTQGVIFGALAVMWSYLAAVGSGGAPLRGMILSGSGALILLAHGAWRINKAQTP